MKFSRPIWLFIIGIVLFFIFILISNSSAEPEAAFSIEASRKVDMKSYEWKVYKDDQIVFNAMTSKDADSFHWDFGDQTVEDTSGATIAHTYLYQETYSVILVVRDGDGNNDSVEGIVTVVEKPQIVLVVRDSVTGNDLAPEYRIKVGQEILLDGRNSKGDIYSYQFGVDLDNTFVSQHDGEGPVYNYKYSFPGTYKIGMKIIDNLGNSSQTSKEEFIIITVEGDTKEENDSGLLGEYGLVIAFSFLAVISIIMFLINARPDRTIDSYKQQGPSTPKSLPPVPSAESDTFLPGSADKSRKASNDPRSYYEPIIQPHGVSRSHHPHSVNIPSAQANTRSDYPIPSEVTPPPSIASPPFPVPPSIASPHSPVPPSIVTPPSSASPPPQSINPGHPDFPSSLPSSRSPHDDRRTPIHSSGKGSVSSGMNHNTQPSTCFSSYNNPIQSHHTPPTGTYPSKDTPKKPSTKY